MPDDAALARQIRELSDQERIHFYACTYHREVGHHERCSCGLWALLERALRAYGDARERAVAPNHCNICMYDPCACLALDERVREQRERDEETVMEVKRKWARLANGPEPISQDAVRTALARMDTAGECAAAIRAQEEKA